MFLVICMHYYVLIMILALTMALEIKDSFYAMETFL